MNFKQKLEKRFLQEGITLNDRQSEQFLKFYEMLIETNKSMNLTAITEEDDVIEKHFVDSLTCRRVVAMEQVRNCIDIGTGAGFPGIPLKIIYPEIEFVLVDSLNKRISFLKKVKEELGLDDLELLHGRAEDLARDKNLRAGFDLCVSRAVANLNVLSEYCVPFVRVNGYFVSYKGRKGMEEVAAAGNCMKILGCKIEKTEEFSLESEGSERVLIKIKKCKGTSKTYPRKAGIPSKNPL